jgi:ribose transport system permease protein
MKYIEKSKSLIAILVLCILISLLTDKFMTMSNFWNVMRQISVNVCISVGMTLVIIAAGIDLSVGSILALSGAVAAGLLKSGIELPSQNLYIGFTLLGCILAAVIVGAILGGINGLTITKFGVPPFVATLAMLTIGRGLTMLYTNGFPISKLGETFGMIGTGWFIGIPIPVWISAGVVGMAILIMDKTAFGRYIYAIGGNEKAAFLSGIDVKGVKTKVYIWSGILAAIGGIMVTSRLDSAQPNAGTGYELDAIAAVVIGGTSLAGGKGSIWGTVLGAITIGILNNGLVLLGVSPFWQQIVKGLVILFAVIIDRRSTGGNN